MACLSYPQVHSNSLPQVNLPERLVIAVEIHEGVHLNVLDEVARHIKLLKMHIILHVQGSGGEVPTSHCLSGRPAVQQTEEVR